MKPMATQMVLQRVTIRPSLQQTYELTSYNQLVLTYKDFSPEKNEVAAMKWLNVEKSSIVPKPATLVASGVENCAYQYGVLLHQSHGACHLFPTSKHA